MGPARSRYSSFPEDPALFFCPRLPGSISIFAQPLHSAKSVDFLALVVLTDHLNLRQFSIERLKAVVANRVSPEYVSDEVRELEAGPDVGDSNHGMGHQPFRIGNSSQIIVHGNADVFLCAQTLIEDQLTPLLLRHVRDDANTQFAKWRGELFVLWCEQRWFLIAEDADSDQTNIRFQEPFDDFSADRKILGKASVMMLETVVAE